MQLTVRYKASCIGNSILWIANRHRSADRTDGDKEFLFNRSTYSLYSVENGVGRGLLPRITGSDHILILLIVYRNVVRTLSPFIRMSQFTCTRNYIPRWNEGHEFNWVPVLLLLFLPNPDIFIILEHFISFNFHLLKRCDECFK